PRCRMPGQLHLRAPRLPLPSMADSRSRPCSVSCPGYCPLSAGCVRAPDRHVVFLRIGSGDLMTMIDDPVKNADAGRLRFFGDPSGRRHRPGPEKPSFRERLREVGDQIAAHDPGLNRLLRAVQLIINIGATISVLYLFIHATHALMIEPPSGAALPPEEAAQIAAQNHGVVLFGMMMGGL